MTALVHVEGDSGPGWWVAAETSWDQLTPEEQADRVVSRNGIDCPGWCQTHGFGPARPAAAVVLHLADLLDDDGLCVWVTQADVVTLDGRHVHREPATAGVGELPDQLTGEQVTRLAGALAAAGCLVSAHHPGGAR